MSPTLPRRARAALVAALTTVLLTPSGPMPATADADVLDGARWYVDPDSAAAREADGRRADDPEAAARFDRIASQPQADWFGDWVPTAEVTGQVARRTATIREAGALPVYVTYAIPARDCGGYSAGGVGTPAEYRDWVEAFAAGLDGGHAVVVVEPDALGLLDCLDDGARADRLALLRHAVDVLGAAGATIYLDAGHAGWHGATEMGRRLRDAGVAGARGFALNVSNFQWTDDSVAYARAVSDHTGGAHAVVDTSRNGRGPAPDGAWCNPDGRGLGPVPTADTADPVVDAYLWVKRPGESDGTCNGGPRAGVWWADHAEGLAARAAGPSTTDDGGALPGRVAGADRVATAVEVARLGWDRADTVVVARSDDPADALAGTALAGDRDAPLLVTPPHGLDPRVADEIRRLGAAEVVVLGGPAAVSEAVVRDLRDAGPDVRRVAGATRTATAVAIADEVTRTAGTALLVHERSWPDALAVSGLAARRAAAGSPWPVLLTGTELTDQTRDALSRLGVERVQVVGGPAVLPPSLDEELRDAGHTVRRIAGDTRHATSVAAARLDVERHGGGPLLLATSAGFADGLAAGALAARLDGPVLLVPRDAADPGQLDWVAGTGALTGSMAVGGPVAVSEVTRAAVARALDAS